MKNQILVHHNQAFIYKCVFMCTLFGDIAIVFVYANIAF